MGEVWNPQWRPELYRPLNSLFPQAVKPGSALQPRICFVFETKTSLGGPRCLLISLLSFFTSILPFSLSPSL